MASVADDAAGQAVSLDVFWQPVRVPVNLEFARYAPAIVYDP